MIPVARDIFNVGAIPISRDEVECTGKHGLSAVEGKMQSTNEGYFWRSFEHVPHFGYNKTEGELSALFNRALC